MDKIILFGTGKYFRTKIELLNQYDVVKIVDNKVKDTTKYCGTEIDMINPCYLEDGEEQIFLMSMFFVSMWKQLVELGVRPERIVYPYFIKPYFQSDSVVDEMVENIIFDKEKITVICKDGSRYFVTSQDEWNETLRNIYKNKYAIIDAIAEMNNNPISDQFATERGTPIDRYYIDLFLRKNSNYIAGTVLEIEDNLYTRKFGGSNVSRSLIMDVSLQGEKIDFNGNLESGEGIDSELADCFICTQTLMYIYDLKAAAKNILRLLKPGGTALITCSGLSQNSRRCMESYGAFWGFNEASLRKIFEDEKNASVVVTGIFGNVKTVTAHLNGLCIEDLEESDFEKVDVCYPLIVYAVVQKNE